MTELRGWASKGPKATDVHRKAHFIDDDGTPACAKLLMGNGIPLRAPFLCDWVPLDPISHLCRECKKMRDPSRACTCGRCRIERRAS